MRGSPLGIGTDIGGSLRIPAACTGIFTLKPSFGRFPHFDARSGLAGQEAIASIHGPMARSVADLRLFAESVANSEPWLKDPKCMSMPWRRVKLNSKPKIGVLWDNGMVTPTPPVKRALKTVVERLTSRGYDVVDWPADLHAEIASLVSKFFVADGGRSVRMILEPAGEPFRPEMKAYETASDVNVYDLWQLHKQRTALQKKYLDRWAACEGLDAILGPTIPYTAPKNGQLKVISYTGVFNILDYSSMSFPTGLFADKEVDVHSSEFNALSEQDKMTNKEYDPVAVHGMPISLQLTGKRLEDEKIMALTEKVCKDIE